MDKKLMILMLADSGLDTAVNFLNANALATEAKAKLETDPAKQKEILKSAAKDREVAKILKAADAAIEAYLFPI